MQLAVIGSNPQHGFTKGWRTNMLEVSEEVCRGGRSGSSARHRCAPRWSAGAAAGPGHPGPHVTGKCKRRVLGAGGSDGQRPSDEGRGRPLQLHGGRRCLLRAGLHAERHRLEVPLVVVPGLQPGHRHEEVQPLRLPQAAGGARRPPQGGAGLATCARPAVAGDVRGACRQEAHPQPQVDR